MKTTLVLLAVVLGGCAYHSPKCRADLLYHWVTGLCAAPGESTSISIDPADMPRGNPAFPVYIAR